MTLIAVDSQKVSTDTMKEALVRAKTKTAPIELLIESEERYRTVKVDWHGGERFPCSRAIRRSPICSRRS